MSARRTIRERAALAGIGLHLGRPCRLTFLRPEEELRRICSGRRVVRT